MIAGNTSPSDLAPPSRPYALALLICALILAVPIRGFGQTSKKSPPEINRQAPAYRQTSASDANAIPPASYKVKEFHERVRMRDGVELAVKIIRPTAEGRFPAIMSYDPYRSLKRPPEMWASSNEALGGSPDPPASADPRQYYDFFAERGYALVAYDARGTGNSGGSTNGMYTDAERQDGYDMVEWIGTQPWCNGNVGMWGISYGGVDTWQVSMIHPPHLKAVIVRSGTDDIYTDWAYPGGVPRPFYLYAQYLTNSTATNFAPPNSEYTGDKWADIWQEHLQNNAPWSIPYLQHQTDGPYWGDRSLRPDYNRIQCPVFVIGGWMDWYGTAELRAFSRLKVPKKALIGPWAHYWPESALPGPRIDGRGIYLRWYDRWLKGIENGIMQEPPVTLYVLQYQPPAPTYIEMKGFWRQENEWPLARAENTSMYLEADGKLSRQPAANAQAAHDDYTYRPSVGIVNGIYARGPASPYAMPLDQRLDEAYSLTYTSPPLTQDTEVTGAPVADLCISSSADVAYFVAKVCDVAPDGTSKQVSYGGLNATHRTSHAHPEALTPGQVYELKIDLEYLAYVFPAGHRIRVDISSADFQNAWPVSKAAVNSLYHSAQHASRVVLPIVPEQNPKLPPPNLPPSPDPMPKLENVRKPDYRVSYDLVNQTATVSVGKNGAAEFTVSDREPENATAVGTYEYVFNENGLAVKVTAHGVTSSNAATFRHLEEVDITVDDKPYFHKSWTISVPRSFN